MLIEAGTHTNRSRKSRNPREDEENRFLDRDPTWTYGGEQGDV